MDVLLLSGRICVDDIPAAAPDDPLVHLLSAP